MGGPFDLRWVHRLAGRCRVIRGPVLDAVASADFPAGIGHVYVAAEAGVVRGVTRILAERGLRPDQISGKAYWRRGLPNAEHGEPHTRAESPASSASFLHRQFRVGSASRRSSGIGCPLRTE